jgi:hypothetical protein
MGEVSTIGLDIARDQGFGQSSRQTSRGACGAKRLDFGKSIEIFRAAVANGAGVFKALTSGTFLLGNDGEAAVTYLRRDSSNRRSLSLR